MHPNARILVVSARETESEAYSNEMHGQFTALKTISHCRHATLVKHEQPMDDEALRVRAREVLGKCRARNIRVIVALSGRVAKAFGGFSADAVSSAGAFQKLPNGPYLTLLPLDEPDPRRKRSFEFDLYNRRVLRRAQDVANGTALFTWAKRICGDTPEAVAALESILANPSNLGLDLETCGDAPNKRITSIGIANSDVCVSVPWESYSSTLYGFQHGLQNPQIRRLVLAILASPKHAKIGHNVMYDVGVLESKNIPLRGEIHDTMLAHKVVYPELYKGLQVCMANFFAIAPWKDDFGAARDANLAKLLRARKMKKKQLPDIWAEDPVEKLLEYNSYDTAAECPLWDALYTHLRADPRLWEQYQKLQSRARMAANMQRDGVRMNWVERTELLNKAEIDLAAIAAEWALIAPGVPIEGEGSKAGQLKFFVETLRAPVTIRSEKTQAPALSSQALLEWEQSPKPELSNAAFTLYRYNKLKKAVVAFLQPLKVERVYAAPNVAGTVGTRFSYSKPNLQQWSKDKEFSRLTDGKTYKLAPNLRGLVIPDDGMILGESDYNALEARAVAYRANVPMWHEWLNTGKDMHVMHVALMFKVWLHRKGCVEDGCDGGAHYCAGKSHRKWKDPDKLRQTTKVMTYARFYNYSKNPGQVVKMLKPSMPDLTETKVTKIFDAFDVAVPQIREWHLAAVRQAKSDGYVETGLGGWRLLQSKRRPDANRLLSFSIQSTCGELMAAAMTRVEDRLLAEGFAARGARVLIQVHDALVYQALPADIASVRSIVEEEMERAVSLWGFQDVVFPVDSTEGPSWRDVKSVEKLTLAA